MKTSHRTLTVILAVIGATALHAGATGRSMEPEPLPIEPSNLFTVPAGQVVRSMDLEIYGAGIFLGDEGSKMLGSGAALGLGDIAQVEIGTMGLIDSFEGKNSLKSVSSGGFKVYIPMWKYWHGVAASFQRSGTHKSYHEGQTYEQRLGSFSVVASLTNYLTPREGAAPGGGWKGVKLKTHLGLKYIDPRVASGSGSAGSFLRPFGGFEMWRKDAKARIMGELDWSANFVTPDKIDEVWIATGGVRFFFSKHVAADIGVRYQSNFNGLSESVLHSKLHFSLPTHLIRKRLVGN